jgi:hypothetical protein
MPALTRSQQLGLVVLLALLLVVALYRACQAAA